MALARIAVKVAEREELLQEDFAHAGLFAQLPQGSAFERLIDVDKSARKSPFSLEGRQIPPDEQHLELAFVNPAYHAIDR